MKLRRSAFRRRNDSALKSRTLAAAAILGAVPASLHYLEQVRHEPGSAFASPGFGPSQSSPRTAAASTKKEATSSSSTAKGFAAKGSGLAAGSVLLSLSLGLGSRQRRRRQQIAQARRQMAAAVLPHDGAEFINQLTQLWNHVGGVEHAGSAADFAAAAQHWADAISLGAQHAAKDLWPPVQAAWADGDPAAAAADAASQAAASAATTAADAAAQTPPLPEGVVLDPNVKYLYGPNGQVLIDPMGKKPITDDWWNGFIGLQSGFIKDIDAKLRELGVEQAFGWTIVGYTCLVKALFFPIQQGQVRSTSMMQLLQPKMKEIQERYKDDPNTQNRLIGQLYEVMDVNPLGGCLPVLLQLPIFWSLYGVWRRLAAEDFSHYGERFLWVPSLAQPNPDFQFKFDWLLEWENGRPKMGWEDYLGYLVFPAILVGTTVISQQQAQASSKAKNASADESQQLIMQVLPWISVYFIGSLSLELPQAVSVYYCTNTFLQLAQTQLTKMALRKEIAGYEEFEKTGKFPDGAFEDMLRSTTPKPKNIHEAALQGNAEVLEELLDNPPKNEDGSVGQIPDINAWDEKQIPPLGYATACGHLDLVKLLLKRGASVEGRDGQENTLLHYASGYGHLEVLKVLLEAGKDIWPEEEWKDLKNKKGQTVIDAASLNRKAQVVDFLCDRLGIDAEEVLKPLQQEAPTGEAAAEETVDAEVVQTSKGPEMSEDAAKARAAMLAMAAEVNGGNAGAASPTPGSVGNAQDQMRDAVQKLKANPQAVEQAKKMMGNMPPQLLSMMSGGKLSNEQVQKAMDAMSEMSTEELMSKADMAVDVLGKAEGGKAEAETVTSATAAPPKPKNARVVD
eukprot:TRINITY_DN7478_c0_g1_i1.p1 TRINITY_DN7478_c0_g1~~TRINITY_DN7478_c0_g1_i1.p1  ORF type:complete len:849 (-),score=233.49 TRINITY_DN7478_c0_g1_i1:260-2806(-)